MTLNRWLCVATSILSCACFIFAIAYRGIGIAYFTIVVGSMLLIFSAMLYGNK